MRAARAWLSHAAGPGDAELHRLVVQHGPVGTKALLQTGLVPADPLLHFTGWPAADQAAEDLAAAERLGVRLVIPEDDESPDTTLQPIDALYQTALRRTA